MKELFIISCTRGRKEETDLYRSLRKFGADRVLFIENNRTGLSTCYNAVLDRSAGRDEIVIFAHDDVAIIDVLLKEKLNNAFERQGYAIAGLAGTASFRIDPDAAATMWLQPPLEACSGAVEHQLPNGSTIMSVYGPTPRRCVVLDGLFLAIDLKNIGDIRFDERFNFHFYDLDFCLTAHQAGLVLGTVKLHVTHRSGGAYGSPAFAEAQTAFRSKWKAGLYRTDFPEEPLEHRDADVRLLEWRDTLAELPVCLPDSAWTGHIPFLFLLFRLARPRVFVELGVDLGASFLAACKAADRFRTETRCIGIDTWQGDRHGGFIDGNAVFTPLRDFVAARYPSCALLRETFDRAAEQFADGSVDILHIDGLHTYDAVRHDFETWFSKLSERSLVLFHDTQVREGDFGVWNFWEEIKTQYRHFEFEHSFGLGVLLTGSSFPRELEELIKFIEAHPTQARLLKDLCKAAAAEMPSRIKEGGNTTENEAALISRLVLKKINALVP